jgi:hypothetical protein
MAREEYAEWYREVYLLTPHWAQVREYVTKRCSGKCERCQTANMDHVHHRHYRLLWQELDDPQCVMGVCAKCHDYLHGLSPDAPAAAVELDETEEQETKCKDCPKIAKVCQKATGDWLCYDCLKMRRFTG